MKISPSIIEITLILCRKKISLSVEEMAKWIIDASGEKKREKALRYLLDGEHGEKVAQRIREDGLNGTWLKELTPGSAYIEGWENNDITELFFRKLPSTAELHKANIDPLTIFISPTDPKTVLNRIWQWWDSSKDDYLSDYDKSTFPGGNVPNFKEDSDGKVDRSSWLILFVLGHCHTMGRQRNFQHRSFIELCIRKGWWQIFSAEKPENRSDEWMRVLDEYIEAQTDSSEYEHWMNCFPAIYRFSRKLDDYAEVLMSLDRYTELKNIKSVLQPKANPVNQGGGISAPPIDRTLGLGASFAIRELKRHGILHGEHISQYCYVPARRVRDLCTLISHRIINDEDFADSVSIHEFLCQHLGDRKSTFHKCYDIPLQIISEDKSLIESMLR